MTRLKPCWIPILTVTLSVLFLGCAGEPFTNTFSPAVGDQRQVKIASVTNTKMAVMGMDINQGQTFEMSLLLDVTEIDPEGNIMLQITIDDLSADQTMPQIPGMDLATAMADMRKAAKDALTLAKGEQFSLKVTPTGDVVLSRDLRELADRVKGKVGATGGNAMMVNTVIEKLLGEKPMEQAVGHVLDGYDSTAAKTGDTWTDTESVSAGLPMTVTSTYTLGEITESEYQVTQTMVLKASGAPDSMPGMPEGMNMQMNIDMAGTGTGTSSLDRNTSWLKESRSNYAMEGKVSMGGMPGGGNMDISVTGSTNVSVTQQ